MNAALPTVTCVVTTYNHERFVGEAVASVLAQDYPAELLDVVVVNDGSTDGTRALLDERFGAEPRVRLIHQDNQGFVSAMNTALAAAAGELIAILDGDDAWPAGRLRAQVPLMARAEVGLVHGDMEIVDADGATLHPSFFQYSRFAPGRGRQLAALIRQNFVSGGATLVRASLRDRFLPIPEELVYPDWYIAARVAEVAEIEHVEASVSRYRMHGSNMGLGGTGRKFFADMRNNVRIQRWMLRHLDTSADAVEAVAAAADAMVSNAARSALELGTRATEILAVTEDERAAATATLAEARGAFDAGRMVEAARLWIATLAIDPWNGSARGDLAVALARLERERTTGEVAAPAPDTRSTAVVAFADELTEAPEMLSAYAAAVDGDADVTLLIQAPAATAQDAADALGRAAAEAGLDQPGAADLLLHPCEDVVDVLRAPVRAVYSRRRKPAVLATLPRVDDTSLDRLKDLAA